MYVPVYKKVNRNFFKKWTPEMAYIRGFFAADGYITVNRRGGQFWCIQITDRDLLYKIREIIGSEHTISYRRGKGKVKDIFRLQIGSMEMCNDLRMLGFRERKTKSLAVPNVPKEYFSDFTRGYFDGDGNVWSGFIHKNRKTSLLIIQSIFTSCSRAFLAKLHARLEGYGITGRVRQENHYFRLVFSIQSSLKLYALMYSTYNGNLYLVRKKKVFESFLEKR